MSETFDAGWLALREGIDHQSRAADLMPPLGQWWMAGAHRAVLDLGCGTGSNLRYLAPKLPGAQSWTLVDHDAALLAHIEAPSRNVSVRLVEGDLAEAGLAEFESADLVTASALLDLVSEAWLSSMVDACARARCGALFALSYDGSIKWSPDDDPFSAEVRDAVNAHQIRDKGLGPALGPAAGRTAQELFQRAGYRTWLLPSPWLLGPTESSLAQALVAGWAQAAAEQRPAQGDAVHTWAEGRRVAVLGGDAHLAVGHVDLLALPSDAVPEGS